MKIAYILLAHKNPSQVCRLVQHLLTPQSHVFIHVDRGSSNQVFSAMQDEFTTMSQITWLPRYYTYWGSFGLVKATLEGLRQVEARGFDYAILLSGQDYPIKPLKSLETFLERENGKSFIEYYSMPNPIWPSDGMKRLEKWYFNVEIPDTWLRTKLNHLLYKLFNQLWSPRTMPDGLSPYGGSQWWCLHRNAFRYLLDFTRQNPKIVTFFKNVRIPDETYFQTVLLNSPLRPTLVNKTLTYIDWNGPPFPRYLSQNDFAGFLRLDNYFARKFDALGDNSILDRIDTHLLV
jgi:hypothetical protein